MFPSDIQWAKSTTLKAATEQYCSDRFRASSLPQFETLKRFKNVPIYALHCNCVLGCCDRLFFEDVRSIRYQFQNMSHSEQGALLMSLIDVVSTAPTPKHQVEKRQRTPKQRICHYHISQCTGQRARVRYFFKII